MADSLIARRIADAIPEDCACEDCLTIQREYTHVLNLVNGFQHRPNVDRPLRDASNRLYEAWLANQCDSQHQFVERQLETGKRMIPAKDGNTAEKKFGTQPHGFQTCLHPFEFPEKPLDCFCDDCQKISWRRYTLADARLPHARKESLNMLHGIASYRSGVELDAMQIRIQHSPDHVLVSREQHKADSVEGKELLPQCPVGSHTSEHWVLYPCGHYLCIDCGVYWRWLKKYNGCIVCEQEFPLVLITKYLMKNRCDPRDVRGNRSLADLTQKNTTILLEISDDFGFIGDEKHAQYHKKSTWWYAKYLRQYGFIVDPDSIAALPRFMLLMRYNCPGYDYVSRSCHDWKRHIFAAHGWFICEKCERRHRNYHDQAEVRDFESQVVHESLEHGGGVALRTVVAMGIEEQRGEGGEENEGFIGRFGDRIGAPRTMEEYKDWKMGKGQKLVDDKKWGSEDGETGEGQDEVDEQNIVDEQETDEQDADVEKAEDG